MRSKIVLWGCILALVVLILAPSIAMVSSASYQYCETHNGYFPREQTAPKSPPEGFIPATGINTSTSCTVSFANDNGGALTAWATFWLTIATGLLFWIARQQYITTRAQLRAYINPTRGSIFDGNTLANPIPARAGIPYAELNIRNSGSTPAYDVIGVIGISVILITDEDRLLTIPSPLQRISPMTAAPGMDFPKSHWFNNASRSLLPAEIAGIGANPPTHGIFVYGRFEYFDAFREKHYTNFRFVYTGAWPPVPNATFTHCNNGNDGD